MVKCMRRTVFYLIMCMTALLSVTAYAEEVPEIPVKNMVTMVDLGANKCIPCKLMSPILDKLRSEYTEKAAILFIDVWQEPDQAKKFGISSIPTQIFYDKNGKEQSRHVGFMSEVDIKKQLDTLLSK